MGARDSDDDIRKYLPDFKTIMREADPAHAEQKRQDALNNPELDQALADLKQGMTAGEKPFAFPVGPAEAAPPTAEVAGGAVAPRVAAAAVVVAPAVARTVTSRARPREAKRRQVFLVRVGGALPQWAKAALAVLAVVGPLVMLVTVLKTPPAPGKGELDAGALPAARPGVSAVPSGSAAPAIPSGSAAPAVSAVPSVEPSGAATAPEKPRQGIKPRGAGRDPHKDAASPSPQKTAEPAAPPIAPDIMQ